MCPQALFTFNTYFYHSHTCAYICRSCWSGHCELFWPQTYGLTLASLTLALSCHFCPDWGSQGWTPSWLDLRSALASHTCLSVTGPCLTLTCRLTLSPILDPSHFHELACWPGLTLAATPSLPCSLLQDRREGVWWATCSACCPLSPCA